MFRIGDFSKFNHVSVRMLRYYDQLGLLKPERVDPFTDYRYYSASQLPRLHRILALQDLGFTLEQIKALLEKEVSVQEMRGMLLMKQAESQNRVDREQERLARIEGHISQIERVEGDAYHVILRQVEALHVAAINVGADQDLTPLFERLEATVAGYEARLLMPPLTLYFGEDAADGDAAVAVPVRPGVHLGQQVTLMELPEIEKMACVVHAGHYQHLYQASNTLMAWVESNGYQTAGPLREVYYRFGAGQRGYKLPAAYLADDEADFVTELQVPVERN